MGGAIKKLGVLPPYSFPQEVAAPLSTAAMKIMTTNNTIIQFFTFISIVVKKCPVIRPVFPYGNIVLQNCFSSCFHKLSQKKVLSVYYLTIVVSWWTERIFYVTWLILSHVICKILWKTEKMPFVGLVLPM